MSDHLINLKRTLAADRRYTQIDLDNDQVWEFSAAGSEPPALTLQSTYGLRCQGIKLFPRFGLPGTTLTDPRTFSGPARIEKRLSNYLLVKCSPFYSLDVDLEYWVPSSSTLCGRNRLFNNGDEAIVVTLEWAALLKPKDNGEVMANTTLGVNTVLSGKTSDLYPVFFLTGGPVPSTHAYPGLSLEMTLPAGSERRVSWALASLNSLDASFTMARQATALSWDAELLKHDMESKRKVFYFASGNKVIDDLLYETQVKAYQCLIQGPAPERRITLLSKRQPDAPLAAYSISAQTRLGNLPATIYDLWIASRILLPAEPKLFKELVLCFLDHQQENGAIPWTIKPNGTPSQALMPPLLADIALLTHESLQDRSWLSQVYPALLDALNFWFHDETAWPVWDHLMQTGMDASPLYSVWQEDDQGINLQYIDNPALNAMLYRECKALIAMSRLLEHEDELPWLESRLEQIRAHVQECWNPDKASYGYRDIRGGKAHPAETCFQIEKDGTLIQSYLCGEARRLLVRCVKKEGFPAGTEVTVHGKNGKKAVVETFHFNPGQFRDGIARLTSDTLFTSIAKVKVEGLHTGERVQIGLVGFEDEDLSLLLPLWAGIPTPEQAQEIIQQTLMKRYLTPLGLGILPADRYADDRNKVNSFWNSILIEGLLEYGEREKAALIENRYLQAAAAQWQKNYLLNETLRVSDGQGIGERDCVGSLPGLTPLLRCLGIERFADSEICFNGLNDHLPSFTVQYGRTNLILEAGSTTVSTLNGSKIEIHEAGKQRVVLP